MAAATLCSLYSSLKPDDILGQRRRNFCKAEEEIGLSITGDVPGTKFALPPVAEVSYPQVFCHTDFCLWEDS